MSVQEVEKYKNTCRIGPETCFSILLITSSKRSLDLWSLQSVYNTADHTCGQKCGRASQKTEVMQQNVTTASQ